MDCCCFYLYKRKRSVHSPESFLCTDTDWQRWSKGETGAERKASVRPDPRPASEDKNHWAVYSMRCRMLGLFILCSGKYGSVCFHVNVCVNGQVKWKSIKPEQTLDCGWPEVESCDGNSSADWHFWPDVFKTEDLTRVTLYISLRASQTSTTFVQAGAQPV